MTYENLKLDNQLCFPVYVVSRLFTREYQPQLDQLGITYPQYLVLMILWEEDNLTVNDIAKKLILNTNTITPLLKRMETQGIIKRQRSNADERKVIIELTEEGRLLQEKAAAIPEKLIGKLLNGPLKIEELIDLKKKLDSIIHLLANKEIG
jgi:DNA-binding MarR family transcriptional regulator